MEIKEEHKKLLTGLGLKEEDFDLFNGTTVSYEFDEEKGVRIYDPNYSTSYTEYIGIDGWSSWSFEEDSFMGDMLGKVNETVERAVKDKPKMSQEEITAALKKKFGKKAEPPKPL